MGTDTNCKKKKPAMQTHNRFRGFITDVASMLDDASLSALTPDLAIIEDPGTAFLNAGVTLSGYIVQ